MIGGKKPLGERNGMAANPGVDKARTEVTALMLMEAHDIGEHFLPFARDRGINDVAAAYRVQDAYARRLMAAGHEQRHEQRAEARSFGRISADTVAAECRREASSTRSGKLIGAFTDSLFGALNLFYSVQGPPPQRE